MTQSGCAAVGCAARLVAEGQRSPTSKVTSPSADSVTGLRNWRAACLKDRGSMSTATTASRYRSGPAAIAANNSRRRTRLPGRLGTSDCDAAARPGAQRHGHDRRGCCPAAAAPGPLVFVPQRPRAQARWQACPDEIVRLAPRSRDRHPARGVSTGRCWAMVRLRRRCSQICGFVSRAAHGSRTERRGLRVSERIADNPSSADFDAGFRWC